MARTHALSRTSPKGGPFIGTCFQCGTTDLPSAAVGWPCENIANLSRDEALVHAIMSDRDSDGSGEAGETGTGSTEGDSAGPKDIAQDTAHDQ